MAAFRPERPEKPDVERLELVFQRLERYHAFPCRSQLVRDDVAHAIALSTDVGSSTIQKFSDLAQREAERLRPPNELESAQSLRPIDPIACLTSVIGAE